LIRKEEHSGSTGETPASPEARLTREQARALALAAGFTEAGLVALPYADEERDAVRFRDWARAGRAGTMRYLERRSENGLYLRERIRVPFPWARSALVCFASYQSDAPLSTETREARSAWIARYAWTSRVLPSRVDAGRVRRPSDYHKVLPMRLREVEARLHEQCGEFESRAYVDTGPVVERALATAAGLGWTGKNTCLIHRQLGSFGFLAVLLTSLEVGESASQRVSESAGAVLEVTDRCGTCTRCLEACPTGALVAPYQMDATRCISYLTIEHKGPIAEEFAERMGRQVFGCDICQDVCPWNSPRRTRIAVDAELAPRAELVNPALEWLGSLNEQSFEHEFNGSPVRRAGFLGLRRNVAIAMGNSGEPGFANLLETWATAADEGLRAAARWALQKLLRGSGPQNSR
jgi:epoxyqueuosine reductase